MLNSILETQNSSLFLDTKKKKRKEKRRKKEKINNLSFQKPLIPPIWDPSVKMAQIIRAREIFIFTRGPFIPSQYIYI